jgi:anti-sigma B factor antagonist
VTLVFDHYAQGDSHTLSLVGELDIATAPELQASIDRLCEDGAREIVLDLHELSFIDSTGLRLILISGETCGRHGCDFSLTRAQPRAQRLFELTGIMGRLAFRGKAVALKIAARQAGPARLPANRYPPSFEVRLDLNAGAPRSARNYVRDVLPAHCSNELRDAVTLLTSEVVTPIVQRGTAAFLESGELLVWLRDDVARVELRVPSELMALPVALQDVGSDRVLLDELADRWATENVGDTARVWFEIDHRASAGRAPGHRQAASDGGVSNGRLRNSQLT